MRRALLLTYHVPPRPGIATVRIGQLMEGLASFGWEIVPMTPDFGDAAYAPSVITTDVVDFKAPMRRLLGVQNGETTSARLNVEQGSIHQPKKSLKAAAFGWGFQLTQYANRNFGWLAPGTAAAARLLERERFDAIISSSPPEATHRVAARVRGDIPWLADLRDPWTGDGMGVSNGPLGRIDRILEPRTLRHASVMTTVSEPIAESLRDRYPETPVFCVRNAYSQRDWDGVDFARPSRATFMYAGQLYAGKRDPRPLLAAISDVLRMELARPEELSFDFYGDDDDWLKAEIRRHGVGSVVHVHGKRSRREILQLERSATRLLLFLWNDPRERGTYTGKLFEYLGARRPILAVGGPDRTVVDDALEETGAGERVRSVKAIRDAIVHAVTEWRAMRTPIIAPDAVLPYESRHLAKRFAEILETLVRVPR